MDGRLARRRWAICLPLLLSVALLLAGCQSRPGTAGLEERRQQFNGQLALSTQAINAGDLAQARIHLQAAGADAVGPREQQKVDSLAQLITGAEALLEGDALRARAAWAGIEDEHLSRELRRRARQIGMTIPSEPREEGGAP